MGLFSSKPSLVLPSTTDIHVPDELRGLLPDPGEMLLGIYPSTVQDMVAGELDRVRFPGGGYDLRGVKFDKKSGPLHLLQWITAGDWITVQVWARKDLGRGQKKEVENIVADLCRDRGVPTAASWTLQAWASADRARPNIQILMDMLASTYYEGKSNITNGMVIDSIKKWRR